MKRVGFIGRGRIATGAARAIVDGHVPDWQVVGALARDASPSAFPGAIFTERAAFFASRPDVIVEAAGPQALGEFGPDALAVADVWTISASALADSGLFDRMERVGASHGHRLRLLAGAFAGLDSVAALSALPGTTVELTAGWTGDDGSEPAVRETASARDIVLRHRGVNSLAAAAIAGTGLDDTRIDYVGNGPSGRRFLAVAASGAGGRFSARSEPSVDPVDGPLMVVGSILAALRNDTRIIWCG